MERMFALADVCKVAGAFVRLGAVAFLMLGASYSYAQSQLFVVISDDNELPDLQVLDRISKQVQVHILDVGAIPRLSRQIEDELSFITELELEEVRDRERELQRHIGKVVQNKKPVLDQVYIKTAVAGEISTRYGVGKTPSIIEIDRQGNYRLVVEPVSVEAGVSELEMLSFLQAPPEIGQEGSGKGTAIDARRDTKGTDDEKVTLVVNDHEFMVPRRQVLPVTQRNRHLELIPDGESLGTDRFRIGNPEAVGDLSGVRLIPTAMADRARAMVADTEATERNGPSLRSANTNNVAPIPSVGSGAQYSILDAIVDGSSFDSYSCFHLRINAICTYIVVRVYCFIGCTVDTRPEASIELAHFNPELLVGSYKRLGASPLQEARLLFGDLQLKINEITLPAVTGKSLANDYGNPEKWAANSSEHDTQESPSTSKFHDVDIIGHPGSIFSYISADDTNPFDDYMNHLMGGATSIAAGAQEVVDKLPASLQNAVSVVDTTTTASPDPIVLAPSEPVDSFFGSMKRPSGGEILLMMNLLFPGGAADAASTMFGLYGTYTSTLALYNTAMAISSNSIIENISLITGVDFAGALGTMNAAIQIMNNVSGGFSGVGLGASDIEMWSMCPKSSDFMKPYFLSGMDLVQWKFNLPEIVYPETYAPPLPNFQDIYVGSGILNNWGSIYPRQGTLYNPDEGKAAAVAAARAAHVVTRPDQSHVYAYLKPYEEKYLAVTVADPFNPKEESTGKWQPLLPDVEDACYVFGDEDFPLLPWTGNRQTTDRNYAYTLWRETMCCPEPRRAGSVAMVVIPIVKIPLPVDLIY